MCCYAPPKVKRNAGQSIRLLTEVSLVQVQQGELTEPVNSTFTGFLLFCNMPFGGKIDRLLKKAGIRLLIEK